MPKVRLEAQAGGESRAPRDRRTPGSPVDRFGRLQRIRDAVTLKPAEGHIIEKSLVGAPPFVRVEPPHNLDGRDGRSGGMRVGLVRAYNYPSAEAVYEEMTIEPAIQIHEALRVRRGWRGEEPSFEVVHDRVVLPNRSRSGERVVPLEKTQQRSRALGNVDRAMGLLEELTGLAPRQAESNSRFTMQKR